MASNELPSTQARLWALATDAADGLHDHEAALGIKQNTEAAVQADLATARGSETAYQSAIQAEHAATAGRNTANSNVKGFLGLSKRQLADDAGHLPAGLWPAGTTEIPYDADDRLKIIGKVAGYLTGNPGAENAGKALSDGRAALNTAVADRVKKKALRDAGDAALRTRLTGLREELGQLLSDDSSDYYYFGLVPPAGAERPAASALHQVSQTALAAGWAHGPRAEKYRPLVQVVGHDADFVAREPQRDENLLLENLPAGATVRFCLTATNAAGESPRSAVVELKLN